MNKGVGEDKSQGKPVEWGQWSRQETVVIYGEGAMESL